jgi:hypothetical protein
MTESSEKLKKLLEERGVKWESQYGGALGRLVDIFDEQIAGAILMRATENADSIKNAIARSGMTLAEENEKFRGTVFEASKTARQLKEEIANAQSVINTAKMVAENTVTDAQDAKVLNLYKSLLTAGKDVFGEERMTDSAIESICESASYIVWRTIMGPKFDELNDVRMITGQRGKRL